MAAPTLDLDSMQASAEQACRLMKVLSHPDRLIILCRLARDELSVGELEAELGVRQPTLSQQLTVLRGQDLVETRREGKQIFYRVKSRQALAVIKVLYAQFCAK